MTPRSGRAARRRGSGSSPDVPKRPIEELTIESIAAGGAGVARLADGRVVFVPRVAPGDRVEAEIDTTRTPAQARVRRVLAAGPDRVRQACPIVDVCGGCDLMQLSESAQIAAHVDIVKQAIEHAVGEAIPSIQAHRAPAALGYRTRVRLFARGDRRVVRVGYREAGSRDLAAVDMCAVVAPSIAPIFGELPTVLGKSSGEGDAQIALGEEGRRVVDLSWRGELDPAAWSRIDAQVRAGAWAGARVHLEGVAKPATFGDPRVFVRGADGAALVLAPGGFGQPSDEGAAMLARRVAELAEVSHGRERRVVELFAGSGTLSVLLARGADTFLAVEIDEAAAACARENLAARGLAGKVRAGDADAFAIPPATELVVLDPPRTGAPGASRAIARSKAHHVVYVSCDAPTLARDLAILRVAGFSILAVEIVELFPQTSHVEIVVRLARHTKR